MKKPKLLSQKQCEELFKIADSVKQHTYPGKDGYWAAVLTDKGNCYPGVSYCSDTFTLTMHGEAVALTHANLHGENKIVAITGPNCHICKQLIYESSLRSGIDTLVIVKEKGSYKQIPISKLMPYPWPDKPTM